MFEKLADVEKRHAELDQMLCDPAVISNREQYLKISKERADIDDLVKVYQRLCVIEEIIAESKEMLNDPEMRDLAKEELEEGKKELEDLVAQIRILLLPQDPNDARNVLLEIRAGTGGDEASLFASDLYRMYSRFAERRNWKTEVMSSSSSASGGYKEIIALICGETVYSRLKYESGVHRVQRVPTTESQGRIHTSTATVAVLPEAEDVDIQIEPKDLEIDVMRAGGPGGQSVNTTDSAVRIHHLPSGLVVICQDEKSQHKNKAKALKVLKSRLLKAEQAKQDAERRDERRSQVGTGERSEKIRTYNFPQDRITDHRIGMTRHNITGMLDGDFDDLLAGLRAHFQAELIRQQAGE